ncbi:hypothetical protein L1987_19704 [Smallanthus sonchifolius]|uniref:Uncharacterized protein n=1 Tax=Smallanthus sonchifolius TaxID=185202 RepID=A0ACB9IQK0_9ASTR|nr:hypothetical protein L1987_19704 [Smallanthus sonchifolius]
MCRPSMIDSYTSSANYELLFKDHESVAHKSPPSPQIQLHLSKSLPQQWLLHILYERHIRDFWRTVVYVDGEVPSVEAIVDGKQLITIEMMINNSLQFYDQDGVKEYSYERLLKCFRLIGYEGELKGVNSKRECFHLLGGLLLMKID